MNAARVFEVAVAAEPAATSKQWTSRQVEWPDYLRLLSLDEPGTEKDSGGVFGGTLSSPRKTSDAVVSRSVVYLDADHARPEFIPDLLLVLGGTALCWHTTYSHTTAAPRYRVHLPANRDMTPDECEVVTWALMEELGREQFDLSCAQPARMMFLPASADGSLHWAEVDGEPLDVGAWLAKADERGITEWLTRSRESAGSLEQDDLDVGPPTARQVDKAWSILKKSAREVEALIDESRDVPFDGRNDALIRRLPTLYRLVLGGCLSADDVDAMMWDAASVAPGDEPWTQKEHAQVSAHAWGYAEAGGGGRPTVVQDFEAVDGAGGDGATVKVSQVTVVPPDTPHDVRDLFSYNPARWTRAGGGLSVEPLARFIDSQMPIALDPLERRLLCYRGGVWRDGEDEVAAALVVIFGDMWSPSKRNILVEFLRDSPDTPRFTRDPVVPDLINCRNGMVRWTDRTVFSHDAGYQSTVQLPWNYDPNATCPMFDAFLAEVLPDRETVEFMWEVIGYLLLSGNPLHKAVLFWGPRGRNGKGTLLRVLSALIGPENASTADLHSLANDKFRTASLYGRLVNIAGDIDSTWLQHTAVIKGLTGGDAMMADRKYGQPFSFSPWAVPVFSANELFSVNDSSEAFFARWLVVPFPRSFYGKEDPDLTDRLLLEVPGVLNKALTGLRSLMSRQRFEPTSEVARAGETLAREGDSVRRWLADRCLVDPAGWESAVDLWNAYSFGGGNDGEYQLGRNKFYRRLEQIEGLRRAKRDGERGFEGMTLREVDEHGEPVRDPGEAATAGEWADRW